MWVEFKFYASLFRRRLGWFLMAVILCTGAGAFIASKLPPVYSAQARLVFEAEKIPDELASSTVQTPAMAHLQVIQQRVMSRESLLDMVERLNVYPGERPSPEEILADLNERITYDIEQQTSRARVAFNATMLNIGFEADTAAMSAAVANELVTLITAEDVEMRTSIARQTVEFFDQEVSRLQQELAESGATLVSFQQENLELLPDNNMVRLARMSEIDDELLAIEEEMTDLTRERARLVRINETVRRREGRGNARSSVSQEIEALRESLADLPEGDPGADVLEDRIQALTRQLTEDGDAAGGAAFYRHLSEKDDKLAELAKEQARLEAELSEIKATLALAPSKAAELAALERDHSSLRTLYDEALKSRALAETGDAIETLSRGQRVAVIEQAAIPSAPEGPKRKLVAVGGAAVGVALGLLIVILLELRLGFLRRPIDLERRLGITPIATLPFLELDNPVPTMARRISSTFAALVLMALIGGGVAIVTGKLQVPSEVIAQIERLKTL